MASEESRVTAGVVELVVATKAVTVCHSHIQQQQQMLEGVTAAGEGSRINAGEMTAGQSPEELVHMATMNCPVAGVSSYLAYQETHSLEQPEDSRIDAGEMVTPMEAVSSPVVESSELVIGREKTFMRASVQVQVQADDTPSTYVYNQNVQSDSILPVYTGVIMPAVYIID